MIRVVAAIIERDGRMLICQRPASGPLGGKWEFPGGKMRPSETPREALERELREELDAPSAIGEVAARARHRYAEMTDSVLVFFLRATLLRTPRNVAAEQMVWARRGELGRYDFLAADRRVIAALARGEI